MLSSSVNLQSGTWTEFFLLLIPGVALHIGYNLLGMRASGGSGSRVLTGGVGVL